MMGKIDMSDPAQVAPMCSPRFWWPAYGAIRGEGGQMIGINTPGGVPLVPNELQMDLFKTFEWVFLGRRPNMEPTPDGEQPTRIIGVKPRKTGLSTVCQGILYWCHMAHQYIEFQSSVMAQDYETTSDLRDMFERYAEYDCYPWQIPAKPKRNHNSIKIGTGEMKRATALSPGAGRGKTPNASHYSESAHYPSAGKRDAKTMMLGRIQSVPNVPGSLIIAESTPNGASGWHHDTFHGNSAASEADLREGAVTLTQWKQGTRGNGWIQLFCPWYRFSKHRKPLTPEAAADLMKSLRSEEARAVDLYGVDAEQIAWRRLAVLYCGGENGFLQEYPEDPISCFAVSGRPYFQREGMDKIQKLIQDGFCRPKHGRLDGRGIRNGINAVKFRETAEPEAHVTIWEMPKRGLKYLLVADPATGADVVKDSRISDRHSVWVIRSGHTDDSGRDIKPRAVARIRAPFQEAASLACGKVQQLAEFYGNCCIVIEANNSGLAWLVRLSESGGVNLYHRDVMDEETRQWKKQMGWMTTSNTRQNPLDAMEEGIREGKYEFFCPHALAECRTTVTHADGKVAGAVGKHDDDVMALGIGFFLVRGNATTCITPGS
jgi:hypothetical protein